MQRAQQTTTNLAKKLNHILCCDQEASLRDAIDELIFFQKRSFSIAQERTYWQSLYEHLIRYDKKFKDRDGYKIINDYLISLEFDHKKLIRFWLAFLESRNYPKQHLNENSSLQEIMRYFDRYSSIEEQLNLFSLEELVKYFIHGIDCTRYDPFGSAFSTRPSYIKYHHQSDVIQHNLSLTITTPWNEKFEQSLDYYLKHREGMAINFKVTQEMLSYIFAKKNTRAFEKLLDCMITIDRESPKWKGDQTSQEFFVKFHCEKFSPMTFLEKLILLANDGNQQFLEIFLAKLFPGQKPINIDNFLGFYGSHDATVDQLIDWLNNPENRQSYSPTIDRPLL